MPRIISGQWRGKNLAAPEGGATRPTHERAREALFNILEHRFQIDWDSTRVLDLFAGSGMLGFEALSRGATYAVFVDTDAQARGVLRTNIEALGVAARTKIYRRDACALGENALNEPFSLIFCDPPYALQDAAVRACVSAFEQGWIAKGAVLALEGHRESATPLLPFAEHIDERIWGEAKVCFYRHVP
jgi:16S rRNA (guanine966-N2)-methyltransferase